MVKRVATIILPRRDCDRKRGRDTRIIIYFLIGSLFSIETLNNQHFFFPLFFVFFYLGKKKKELPSGVVLVSFRRRRRRGPREKAERRRVLFFSLSLSLALLFARARLRVGRKRGGRERYRHERRGENAFAIDCRAQNDATAFVFGKAKPGRVDVGVGLGERDEGGRRQEFHAGKKCVHSRVHYSRTERCSI